MSSGSLSSSHPITMMIMLLLLIIIACCLMSLSSARNFYEDFDITWGDGRAKIIKGGHRLTLSLDKSSGSGFQSKAHYLFAKIDMQIKLIPGDSAGTVTAYYLSSQGPTHDEIDFEFLGNSTGKPYTLHTNVFTRGKGDREQQFRLWFDPTKHFHTYSVLWTPRCVVFLVDGTPIREFKNLESRGVAFPTSQAMRVYSSIWNADDWATQGGSVKTDWSKAPFTASYMNFNASDVPSSSSSALLSDKGEMDSANQERMRSVQRRYMIYNYCTDAQRFPQGLGPECYL